MLRASLVAQIVKQPPAMQEKWSEVAQSCLTLCNPMDCSPPGSSVHGIFQAWILEWVAISFSRGSSWPRDQTLVSHTIGRRFTIQVIREETDMQSTSCEMLGCMKHQLESRLPGEISITSDMQMTPPLWQKVKKNKRASWRKWKEESEKVGLKLNI